MRKAFAIEFELPDDATDAETQLLHDALSRIDRYVPGGVKVVNVLPFEAWTGTANDPNQNDPIPASVTPIVPSDPLPPSGMPVKVTTAAVPKLAGPVAEPFMPGEVPAGPTFLFPKGLPPEASPEPSGTAGGDQEEFLTLTLRRDILAAMAKGAYYEEAAKFYAAILEAMPADRQSVLISADDWV